MNNLRENGRYEILLPPDGTNWEVVANQYKQSLAAGDLRLPRINTYMKFRVSPYVFGAGYCIMELDLRKLLKKREMLAQELLCDYIGQVHDLGNGKVEIGEPDPVKSEQVSSLSDKRYLLGTVLSPSTKMNGVSLMDRHRLALAMDAWADSWRPDGEVA